MEPRLALPSDLKNSLACPSPSACGGVTSVCLYDSCAGEVYKLKEKEGGATLYLPVLMDKSRMRYGGDDGNGWPLWRSL